MSRDTGGKGVIKGAAKSTKASISASAVIDNCQKCDKPVEDEDSALECEICVSWFHIGCEEISEEEYTFLSEHKSVHWYCKSCNKSVANVIKLVSSLTLKIDAVEANVTKLSKKIDVCDKRVDDLSEGILPDNLSKVINSKISEAVDSKLKQIQDDFKGLKDLVSKTETKLENTIETRMVESVDSIKKDLEPTWASIVGKEVDTKFEKVSNDVTLVQSVLEDTRKKANEERERENRSNNIILYRVPEVDNKDERVKADKAFCIELFNDVLELDAQDSDFKFFRLGKRDQSNRPLLVQCREKTFKNRIMECLHKLRNAELKFKNISVTHDLTLNERTECKALVEEAKKKQADETGEYLWRVRGLPGQLKVIKLKKN